MNRSSALKILIASSHADTRVAVSWMLRQAYPAAVISKAENSAEEIQATESDVPDCVVVDASLIDLSTELASFSESLWQCHVPLILIHDGTDASPMDADSCRGVAAWLVRSSLNVGNVELAISKAVTLASLTCRIAALEQEAQQLRNDKLALEAAATEVMPADGETSNVVPVPPPLPDRPKLLTTGREVSTEDERELAGRVQKHLMPPGSPLIDGLDIAGLSIHAEATGGDYYDYLPMSDELLCVSLGECSGRGLAPAMLMASLRAYLRVLVAAPNDISDVLSQANTLITEDIGDEEFIVTLMLVLIDQRTRTLRYASAGHQAYFLDRDGNVEVLHSTGMPLGLRDETVIPEGPTRKLQNGEILLLASDGVQKMTSDSGEQFGTQRMLQLVHENRTLPSRMIANYLRTACTEFASSQFLGDDITIVSVKVDDSAI
ncbi:MAG: SpoIIE family protein phosphatase [Planctomycetota bacterium]|nr:SpoIIE family protein phosphatase [Planctomycetota bacterium]